MPKRRDLFSDALARLFEKPLAELDRSERAELDVLRALDADHPRKSDEQLAAEHPEEPGDETIH